MKNENNKMETNSIKSNIDNFTKIYEDYYKRIFKYICYRIDDKNIAEELCSQIFERIMIKYHTFSGNNSSFESWIFKIAKNTINDFYRKKYKFLNFSLDSIINRFTPKSSPDEIILSKESNVYLLKALQKLNEKERSIVSLKYGAELKNTQIAKLMNLNESNVNVILHRSLKKLKKTLENGGFKYE